PPRTSARAPRAAGAGRRRRGSVGRALRRSWLSMPPRRRSLAAPPSTVFVVSRVLAYLAGIGADPQDDEDTRAGKALLVLISVLILPVALLWATLYLAFGSPVGWVPLVYFA